MGVGQDDGRHGARRAARLAVRRHRRRRSRRAPDARSPRSSSDDGEPAFRELEPRRCADVRRRRRRRRSIACGGGVVLDRGEPAAAASVRTSSCGCGPTRRSSSARAATGDHRPLLARRPARASLARLAVEREPLVPTRSPTRSSTSTGRSPDEVADGVLDERVARVITVPRRRSASARYDVVVGAGARAPAARRCCPTGVRRAAVVTQAAIGVDVDPGVEHAGVHDRRRARTPRRSHRRGPVPRVRAVGPDPRRRRRRRRRRRGHRHRRLRRRGVPPRRPVVHVADHAARRGRRRDRRQDRREPARGQEPRRRVLAAGGGAVRHRRAGDAAAARVPQRPRRDGEVPLPRPVDDLDDLPLDERIARVRARSRPRSSPPTSAKAGGGRILNYGHTLGPRARDGRRLRPAPRRGGRHRAGVRRRAGAARSAASTPTGSPSTGAVVGRLRPARCTLPAGVDADELVALYRPRQEGGRRAHVRARRPARRRAGRRASTAARRRTRPSTAIASEPMATIVCCSRART